jgi:hypothetical protein
MGQNMDSYPGGNEIDLDEIAQKGLISMLDDFGGDVHAFVAEYGIIDPASLSGLELELYKRQKRIIDEEPELLHRLGNEVAVQQPISPQHQPHFYEWETEFNQGE